MNKITFIIIFICEATSTFAQLRTEFTDLIEKSDFILAGTVQRIDTLTPEVRKHYSIKRNNANFKITSTLKGNNILKNINVLYYTEKYSHSFRANPQIDNKYLLFLNYDNENKTYILSRDGYAIAKIVPSNEIAIINIIKEAVENIEYLNKCEYFDLITKNIEEPIFEPFERQLKYFRETWDSLEIRFCIDSLDKNRLFQAYIQTKSLSILPFLGSSYSHEIDSTLKNEIDAILITINESSEIDGPVDILHIPYLLKNMSFLKSKSAISEIDELFEYRLMGRTKQFVTKTKEIIIKYGSQ